MPVIRLIACDVDGTLLRDGQTKLSSQVAEEIVRLQAKGILFCPASGRQYNSLRKLFAPVADQLYYICENGAVIFAPGSPGKLLAKETMERTSAMELCRDILSADQCEIVMSGVNLSYLCPKGPDIVEHVRDAVGNRVALVNRPEEVPEDLVKVSAYCRQSARSAEPLLAPKWSSRFRAAIAGEQWLDFTIADKGTDSGLSAQFLGYLPARYWPLGTTTTIFPCWNWREIPISWKLRRKICAGVSPAAVLGWKIFWPCSDKLGLV